MFRAEAAIPTIPVNGVELYYEILGAGEPLLLLAGFGCDHAFWQPITAPLAERYRVILPDNRGSGRTKSSGGFSARDLAGDAAALLDALGFARAHVAGHSFGGQIAQELAIHHPERVASLALLSTSARSGRRLKEVVETAAKLPASAPPEICCRTFLAWMFTEKFFEAPGALEAELARILGDPHPPTLEGLAAQAGAIGEFDAADRVGAIRCPTLVLSGAADSLLPPGHARDLAAGIRGSMLVLLERGAHDLIHEIPEEVSGALLSFLSSVSRPAEAVPRPPAA